MDKPVAWGLMVSSFVVSLLSLVFIAALMIHFSSEKQVESRFDKGNGVVTNIWIETEQRLDVLQAHDVRYLFVDVGGTDSEALLTTPAPEMQRFVDFIDEYESRTGYDFVLLPYSEVNSYQTDISRPEVRENFVNEYKRLHSMGFDGLLVDIEPVRIEHRDYFLNLLDMLNDETDDNFIISAYANAMEDDRSNEWVWDPQFYGKVAEKVDIISASGYDTDSVTAADYQAFIENQVKRLAKLNHPSILFALPTHKPYPEQLGIALDAYGQAVSAYPKDPFLGLTIFAEWTASSADWERFGQFLKSRQEKGS